MSAYLRGKQGFSFFMQRNLDYRITSHLKVGLWDYTPFEIGITGLQDSPFQGPTHADLRSASFTIIQTCLPSYVAKLGEITG